MKALEKILAPVFSPKKQWDEAKVVPAEVYRTINKILQFAVLTVWPIDSETTASIKVRCQQQSRPPLT
ncbi:MAG: hypothetical protein DMG13_26335 [Acidobacteria bacterium]|nr:MAG: hypothetical protein DMG13_26335 [Acidobacteriota bacterium]